MARVAQITSAGILGAALVACGFTVDLELGETQSAIALPAPTNIQCRGYARDTIRITWQDQASDETSYRVERQIGASGWTEIKSLATDATLYDDEHADVSTQNRHYRVRAARAGDNSFSPYSDVCNNRRIFDTAHFRIFYGLLGTTDECPKADNREVCLTDKSDGVDNVFVKQTGDILEGAFAAFDRVGFRAGSATTPPPGLDKVPINITECIGAGGGCAGNGIDLSTWIVETPFDLSTRAGDPRAWTVTLHESFHYQQYQYPGLNDPDGNWAYEGQARSVQDKICIGADRNNCQSFDDIGISYTSYVSELQGYLSDTTRPINHASYAAVLFWTYMTERFGTSVPTDKVENGMNMLVQFWTAAQSQGGDGITAINNALTALGHPDRFREIWKDFAVANYAKDLTGPGVQPKYHYEDMTEPGGAYGPVTNRSLISSALISGQQLVATGVELRPWSAHYYELRPAADVSTIDIKITPDNSVPAYYTVLAIKNNDVIHEDNLEATSYAKTLPNEAYDRVVVIVAGLDRLTNYRYSFNGTQPTLVIDSPTTGNPGWATSPRRTSFASRWR